MAFVVHFRVNRQQTQNNEMFACLFVVRALLCKLNGENHINHKLNSKPKTPY